MLATKKKAVLFDLDGTLLDTIDDLAESMNAALASLGYPGHDRAAYKLFVGEGMEVLARRALPDHARAEGTINRLVEAMRFEYGRRWKQQTAPYPGIAALLDGLTARGTAMAVLSNKTDAFTQIIAAKYLSAWNFAAIIGARPGMAKKPDPTGALEIARLLNTNPTDFLYLGDTATDMQTANAAGMYAAGALWGFRSAEELLKNGAAVLLGSPGELLSLL